MIYALALGGLILLLASGDLLVRGAISLAANLGISPLLMGLIIVGFGTSAPELIIGVEAALTGAPGVALGNIVGSNIANVLLVLGAPALIAPVAFDRSGVMRHILVMLGVSLIFAALAFGGVFGFQQGVMLLAMLAGFLFYSIRNHQLETPPVLDMLRTDVALGGIAGRTHSSLFAGAMAAGGMAGLVLGAKLLIDGAVAIARMLEVGEDVIGLSMVAAGTSLPELATTLAAARRRHPDVALGNVIGSNIFNILAVMGITAAIAPAPVPQRFLVLDFPVMLAAAAVLLAFAITRRPIGRGAGAAFLLAYALYMILLFRLGGV
ncbi:MAG TPA: calcium/sodium antiporter [Alphaproteobacteria bacterium]|nr:calcium/sodium antiporter [Alphaproteobacteria bacterium]